MSADFSTEHMAGYFHRGNGGGYIHVVYNETGQPALGSFNLGEITELAEMAGWAWPADDRIEVRYVIEASRPGQDRWMTMWSALADEDSDGGVSEEYAQLTLDSLTTSTLQLRLLRRTTLTAVEVLHPEPAEIAAVKTRLEADGARLRAGGLRRGGAGHDSTHDGLEQDQG